MEILDLLHHYSKDLSNIVIGYHAYKYNIEILHSTYKPVWDGVIDELIDVANLYNKSKKLNQIISSNGTLQWIIHRERTKYSTLTRKKAIDKATYDYRKFKNFNLKAYAKRSGGRVASATYIKKIGKTKI